MTLRDFGKRFRKYLALKNVKLFDGLPELSAKVAPVGLKTPHYVLTFSQVFSGSQNRARKEQNQTFYEVVKYYWTTLI